MVNYMSAFNFTLHRRMYGKKSFMRQLSIMTEELGIPVQDHLKNIDLEPWDFKMIRGEIFVNLKS